MWKISTKIWVAVGMSLMLAMGSSAILLTRLHYTTINYDRVVENNTATKDAARSGHAGQGYGQFPGSDRGRTRGVGEAGNGGGRPQWLRRREC